MPGGIRPGRVLQLGEVTSSWADQGSGPCGMLRAGDTVRVRGRRQIMKNGFHVYDADTHVSPAAETLERYVDPGFRPRLAELAPYRQASGEGRHHYSFG